MKPFLFLNLGLIFSSSILLVILLFFNCLNETHFIAAFGTGFVLALIISLSSYKPNSTIFASYFVLAFFAFLFLMYQLTVSGFVYSFSEDSRQVFIERQLRAEMTKLPQYAIQSEGKFGNFSNVCVSPLVVNFYGKVENIYQKESCLGPLGFLLFEENYLNISYKCNDSDWEWAIEESDPSKEGYLCIDRSRVIVANKESIGEATTCR